MKKNTHINFALAGCGRIAETHLLALKKIPNAHIYALCDVVTENVERFRNQYGISNAYYDYAELLADEQVDVVIIGTPSGFHAEMAIEAAKNGKHVILEKPMAITTSDAQRILQAFKESNSVLKIALQNRYNRPIAYLKGVQNQLGKLNYISANLFWYRDDQYYQNTWRGTRNMDGGVLLNQGSHYIDMLLYLAGKDVANVSAYGGTFTHSIETEDIITANITFSDGTLGNIQANTISYPQDFEGSITLFYDKATIKIGGKALNKIIYWKGHLESEAKKVQSERIKNIYGNGHVKVFKNVISHLTENTPLDIPGSEGLKSLSLIEQIQTSILTHSEVQSL